MDKTFKELIEYYGIDIQNEENISEYCLNILTQFFQSDEDCLNIIFTRCIDAELFADNLGFVADCLDAFSDDIISIKDTVVTIVQPKYSLWKDHWNEMKRRNNYA